MIPSHAQIVTDTLIIMTNREWIKGAVTIGQVRSREGNDNFNVFFEFRCILNLKLGYSDRCTKF